MLKTYQILGCSAGIPTEDRNVTSLVISLSKFDIMIDCGEGTYLQWKKAGYKWNTLRYILITHMHPDHTAGILPLLFYRKILSINNDLTIIGPPDLELFLIDSFKYLGIKDKINYKFIDVSKKSNHIILDDINIINNKMSHKISCWGYRIQDKNKSLVFITDTRSTLNAIKLARKADILIHEATYDHSMHNVAYKQFHSTNIQAMEIADAAEVNHLILTHFSPRLSNKELQKWIWNGKHCVVFNKKQKI